MNKILTLALSALMVLALFAMVSPASAQEDTVESVEIRGPVYTGDDLSDIFDDNDQINADDKLEMNTTNFAGFYYELGDDEGTERLTINDSDDNGDRTVAEDAMEYYTKEFTVDPTFDFSEEDDHNKAKDFEKIGFLAEEYVPVGDDAGTLSKVLMDDDTSHTMRTEESLELGEGYEITPQQIDTDGDKVWLELTKDGEFVDDKIINVGSDAETDDKTWYFEQDVAGEEDVLTLMVHVDEVFQGDVDSLAVIDGVWQISDTASEIEDDDEFGKLDNVDVGDKDITITNDDDFTLDKDSTVSITDMLSFKVADSGDLRFYLMQEITEPGTYEIRGTVANATVNNYSEWDANEFAGFYYDIDDNIHSEEMNVTTSGDDNRTVDKGDLNYNTTKEEVDRTFWDDTQFPKIGLFAEEYVPVGDDAGTLSKVLMDDDTGHTMRTEETLELEEGYEITPQQIDVDGDKVWLELTKDGEFVDDKIISTDDGEMDRTWKFEQDVAGEEDVETLWVHVDEVFQGNTDSLAVIEGVWQISDTAREIDDDSEFDKFDDVNVDADSIEMTNDDDFTLDEDSTESIAEGISFRVADDEDHTRFYPYVERTIEDDEQTEPEEPTAGFTADPTSGEVPLDVSFADESENAEEYSWDFGDGENSTEANPTHTYEEAGEYTVTLTVSNDEGEEDTAEETITVKEEGEPDQEAPTAGFSADPTSGEAPLDVSFTDESENAETYSWDFGDGNTSTEANPTHTYEEAGEYTATLTVSNDEGDDTEETTITVEAPEEEPPEEEPGVPGFEAVFAIAGLLAIAFLVRRRN